MARLFGRDKFQRNGRCRKIKNNSNKRGDKELENKDQSEEEEEGFHGRLDGEAIDSNQTQPHKKRSYFSPPSATEYARVRERMGENHRRPSSRLGLKIAGGEIVEVEGGHIVRSTGRKDRHSKVCTAKGARDRRVRLSAHTAIQFYDVQDRLGYDRPSKAVDWLINKAKNAIDELAVLPPWHPTATTANAAAEPEPEPEPEEETVIRSSKRPISVEIERSGCDFQHQEQFSNNPSNSSSFLPHFLDSDTIKPFFPMAASATFSSSIHFQNYPLELLSRNNTQSQDLRLSLHSNQDPVLLHHHSNPSSSSEQVFFSGSSTPLGFDSTSEPGWSEQQQPEMGQFIFNSPPLQPFLGLNPLFSQRGPLQSSNSPSVRAWTDRPIATIDHHQTPAFHQSSISGIGFASGGFSGFRIPARIQGEEEHDAVSNKPSSASRH